MKQLYSTSTECWCSIGALLTKHGKGYIHSDTKSKPTILLILKLASPGVKAYITGSSNVDGTCTYPTDAVGTTHGYFMEHRYIPVEYLHCTSTCIYGYTGYKSPYLKYWHND